MGIAPPDISEQILLELAALRAFVHQSRDEVMQAIQTECLRLRNSLDGRLSTSQSFSLATMTDFSSDELAIREEELARLALEAARKRVTGLPGEGHLTARANGVLKALSESAAYGAPAAEYNPSVAPQLIDAFPSEPMLPLMSDMVLGSGPGNPFTAEKPISNEVGRGPELVHLGPEKVALHTPPLWDDADNPPRNRPPARVGFRSDVAGRTHSGMGSPLTPPAQSPANFQARSPVATGARSPVTCSVRSPIGARTPHGAKSPSTCLIEQHRQNALFADGHPKLWGDEEIKSWIRVTMRMSARFPDKRERTDFLWRRYDALKVQVVPEQQADMEELAHWLVKLVQDD